MADDRYSPPIPDTFEEFLAEKEVIPSDLELALLSQYRKGLPINNEVASALLEEGTRKGEEEFNAVVHKRHTDVLVYQAAKTGDNNALEWLANHHADLDVAVREKDANGHERSISAVEISRMHGHEDTASRLENAVAMRTRDNSDAINKGLQADSDRAQKAAESYLSEHKDLAPKRSNGHRHGHAGNGHKVYNADDHYQDLRKQRDELRTVAQHAKKGEKLADEHTPSQMLTRVLEANLGEDSHLLKSDKSYQSDTRRHADAAAREGINTRGIEERTLAAVSAKTADHEHARAVKAQKILQAARDEFEHRTNPQLQPGQVREDNNAVAKDILRKLEDQRLALTKAQGKDGEAGISDVINYNAAIGNRQDVALAQQQHFKADFKDTGLTDRSSALVADQPTYSQEQSARLDSVKEKVNQLAAISGSPFFKELFKDLSDNDNKLGSNARQADHDSLAGARHQHPLSPEKRAQVEKPIAQAYDRLINDMNNGKHLDKDVLENIDRIASSGLRDLGVDDVAAPKNLPRDLASNSQRQQPFSGRG